MSSLFKSKSKEALQTFKMPNIPRIPRSATSPNISIETDDSITCDLSPILNIYMGLPPPIDNKQVRYDPFDLKTPFHDYIKLNGHKRSNPNWQSHPIDKPLLKQTNDDEKAFQLFTLMLKYEKTVKPFEKPNICGLMLEMVKDNIELNNELCCQLLKQLMNNRNGALQINWALFVLLFPCLKTTEDIRLMVIQTLNSASPSQFDLIINELKLRVVRNLPRRLHRPSSIEITKYEEIKNEFTVTFDFNNTPFKLNLNNYDTGRYIWQHVMKSLDIDNENYAIILRDQTGESQTLKEDEYFFDHVSHADQLKYISPKWIIRRSNWNIELTNSNIKDTLYFIQMCLWVPTKAHSLPDHILSLYKTLFKSSLIKVTPTSEPQIKQIFSQIAVKEVDFVDDIAKAITKLPYYGSMRYNIRCESLLINLLYVYGDKIEFYNNDAHFLTIPSSQMCDCELLGIYVKFTFGTANSRESIVISSSSRNCIVNHVNSL
eukprot:NODE_75_length_23955_cov_0.435069.p3 type:complete len:488 gc:universal NODE_75_length_23955_cov_0.435069:11037-9574(-)